MSSPHAYWLAVAIGAVLCVAVCVGARRRPGPWVAWAGRIIALLLLADAVTFVGTPIVDGTWTAHGSLPLDLCDVALVIAALASWQPRWQLLVGLTYFWGLAGTLQAVGTPDLSVGFPHLEFFEFVVGHVGIVFAALYLVVALRLTPRRGSVARVYVITVIYTAIVGVADAITGGNYMFLRHVPAHTSLLSALGPWPWYILSAAVVALVLFLILDAPFRYRRARAVDGGGSAGELPAFPPAAAPVSGRSKSPRS